MAATLVWQSVSWRSGGDHFTFEIERGGLLGTIKAPGNRSITLPVVVWEGLLDALAASRAARERAERQFPVRTGTRWYEGEADELAKAFLAGRSIRELARAHHRTEYAIEGQLDKMGWFSKAQKYRPGGQGMSGARASGPPAGIGVHPLDAPAERDEGDETAAREHGVASLSSHSPTR